MKVSDKIYNLCRSTDTVSAELAKNPTESPRDIAERLYGRGAAEGSKNTADVVREYTPENLQRAFDCGKWGTTRPSQFFLKIYEDVLCTYEEDTLASVVSPPLIGSSGIMPLTVISTGADICRHMSNVIARAQNEVFLATNYWQSSYCSKLIANALKELSRRAGERGHRAVVKVMYDRGNPKQVFDWHQYVSPNQWTAEAVQLPSQDEIPNIDMEVVNYHRPMLGTFHAKFMVADRRIAIISSNNIQDNDNLEMMTHCEGPIVDSLYDMALVTWHNKLNPPLPRINSPAALDEVRSFDVPSFRSLFNQDGSPKRPIKQAAGLHPNNHPDVRKDQTLEPLANGVTNGDHIDHSTARLPEHTVDEPHYDEDIASEFFRVQSVISASGNETTMQAVTRHLNGIKQPDTVGDAPECAVEDEMMPYVPHAVHQAFPIALVNRKPYGALTHSCVYTPQNEAWLSAIRNAERSIFIQTPNLNAKPLLPALAEAVCRGIDVTIYVCLGYNDSGELLPLQGGTNEMVSHSMYKDLSEEDKQHLHVFYYIGKDMVKPINNKFKKRSCHIKLLIADDHIGIQGSGNQDTQSWFHSQEVNIMFDSKAVCADWIEALRRNQNTYLYGAVNKEDGIWRDEQGNEAEGSIGVDPGSFSWAKGIVGAIQRVRGAGGF